MIKVSVEQFDGGIQPDPRSRTMGGCAMSRHFDHTFAPNKLVPRRDFLSWNDLDGTTDGMEDRVVKCLGFADGDSLKDSNGDYHGDIVLAVGKKASGTGCAVFFTEIEGDTTVDGNDYQWTFGYDATDTILESSSADPAYGPMVQYSTDSSGIFHFPVDYSSLVGADAGYLDFGYPITLNDAVGLSDWEGYYWDYVEGPDRTFYITRNVNTASTSNPEYLDALDGDGTFTENVFALQPGAFVTGVCRNGDYVGISTITIETKSSELHIWDTVNDDPLTVVQFGPGRMYWLDSLNGDYIGIVAENYIYDAHRANGNLGLVMRVSNGGEPVEVTRIPAAGEIDSSYFTGAVNPITHKRRDEFLFYTKIPTNAAGTEFDEGLWSVRKSSTGQYALTLAYDTSSLGMVMNWLGVGDHAFFVHGANSSISRVNTTESYTITSSYETLYNPQMSTQNYFKKKRLAKFRIKSEPLPTAGQIVVKYRKDEETSWTTIGTITTDNNIYYEMVNIESTGAELPEFKEIQFRLESTGGAVITGYEYVYELQDDLTDG